MRRRLLFGGKLIISEFTVDDIPASGGTISSAKTLKYNIGNVTSGGVVTYSAAITASSLGTTVKERTKVGTLTVTVKLKGVRTSKTVDVYQQANNATTTGILLQLHRLNGDWNTENLISLDPAGVRISSRLQESLSYTSGATNTVIYDRETLTSDMKFLSDSDWLTSITTIGYNYGNYNIANRGTTEGAERTGTVWIEWKGFTSNRIKVTQQANVKTYTSVELTVNGGGSDLYVSASPGSIYFTTVKHYSYSSGATSSETVNKSTMQSDQTWMRDAGYSSTAIVIDNRGTTEGPARTGNVWTTVDGKTSSKVKITQEANEIVSTTYSGQQVYLSADPNPVPVEGGNVTISASAERYRKDTYTSGESTSNRETTNSVTLSLSGGGGAFSLSSSTVTVSENPTTSERSCTITGTAYGTTGTLIITQDMKVNYGEITITSVSADDIPASGGTITTVTYSASQTYGYGTSTTNGGTYTTGFTITYKNSVTAGDLGTTVKERTKVGTIDFTVHGRGGKTKDGSCDVYQEANTQSLSRGPIIYWEDKTGSTWNVPASGGVRKVIAKYEYNYTSGSTSEEWDENFTDFSVTADWARRDGRYIGVDNRSTVTGDSRTVYVYNNQNTSDTLLISQDANTVTVTQGSWDVSISANPTSIGSSGGTSTITASASRTDTYSYTSGSTTYNTVTVTPTVSITDGDSAFSYSGGKLSVGSYSENGTRSCTLTATYGGESDSVTVSQSGLKITVEYVLTWEDGTKDTKTLVFSPTGETKTVNVISLKKTYYNGVLHSSENVGIHRIVDMDSSGFKFSILGQTITIEAGQNISSGSKTGNDTVTQDGGNSGTLSLKYEQAAATAQYGDIEVRTFSVDDIPASGGTISSGRGSWRQSYGYDSTTGYYDYGTFTGTDGSDGGATISYSSAVTAGNLGNTVKSRTKVGTITVTVKRNGKTASKSVDVYQAFNSVKDWGDNSATCGTVKASGDVPASGGTARAVVATNAKQIITYSSGATRNATITFSATDVKGEHLHKNVKARTKLGTSTGTFSGEHGWSCKATTDIYQQENQKSYGGYSLTISANPTTISYSGGTSTISTSASRTVTYTSGDAETDSSGTPTLAITANASGNPFSLRGNTVSVGQNTTDSERQCTVTATIN